MSTPTTTLTAIREKQQTLIEILAPASLDSVQFREHKSSEDFEAWAENAAGASLRRYEVRNVTSGEPPPVSDLTIVEENGELEYVIAYPHMESLYGEDWRRDMDDVIDSDRTKICNAIGAIGYSDFVDGQHNCLCTWSTDKGQQVSFLRIVAEINYYRSAT